MADYTDKGSIKGESEVFRICDSTSFHPVLWGFSQRHMPRFPIPQNSCKTSPMKNLTILLALTFSVMFSSPSYAEWKRVSVNVKGNVTGSTFYVDFAMWILRKLENTVGIFIFLSIKNSMQGLVKTILPNGKFVPGGIEV